MYQGHEANLEAIDNDTGKPVQPTRRSTGDTVNIELAHITAALATLRRRRVYLMTQPMTSSDELKRRTGLSYLLINLIYFRASAQEILLRKKFATTWKNEPARGTSGRNGSVQNRGGY